MMMTKMRMRMATLSSRKMEERQRKTRKMLEGHPMRTFQEEA